MEVMPTMSEGTWAMRFLKVSGVSFSAWASMTVTSWPACSATAPKYAMPRGMNGGCECACGGYGGLMRVTFMVGASFYSGWFFTWIWDILFSSWVWFVGFWFLKLVVL